MVVIHYLTAQATTEHIISDLELNTKYTLYINDKQFRSQRNDLSDCIKFRYFGGYTFPQTFEIK